MVLRELMLTQCAAIAQHALIAGSTNSACRKIAVSLSLAIVTFMINAYLYEYS
jgi:hypothetical protein